MADYAALLRDHITLICRSVDRVFLQASVPKLQTVGWVYRFLHWQRHYVIPSWAAFGKIGDPDDGRPHRADADRGVVDLARLPAQTACGRLLEAVHRPTLRGQALRRRRRHRPGPARAGLVLYVDEKSQAQVWTGPHRPLPTTS